MTGPSFAYVGTYTRNVPTDGDGPRGIHVLRVDAGSGRLEPVQTVSSDNPSFLALSPDRRFLFATNEIADYEGERAGSIESWLIDPADGRLSLLSRQALPGVVPAHVAVDPTGRHLVVSLYGEGAFTVMPVDGDGVIGSPSHLLRQQGSGPEPRRQAAPHPHSATFDPSGRHLVTADLGTDKVESFRLEDGRLVKLGEMALPPGSGPRHTAFAPDGRMLYVLNELNATLTALPYDMVDGRIGTAQRTLSTLPESFEGTRSTAAILAHPSGRFLYSSNRKLAEQPLADAVIAYGLDAEGLPEQIQAFTDGVAFPRAMQIDPAGRWLHVLNQKGHDILQLAIDPLSGRLAPTGHVVALPAPVCLVFAG